MVAKHFTELEVWQLAQESRQYLFELTASGPVARDFEFRAQIRDAADSACENIAEGFGRYRHKEFSRFLEISKSSMDENESQLLGGLKKAYFTAEQVRTGCSKIEHARRALLGLKRYLDRSQAPKPFGR